MIKPTEKNKDGLKRCEYTKGLTYVLTKRNNYKHCFVFEDGKMTKIFTSPENEIPEGSIIVGRISEIVPSIHAAFVCITPKEKCFVKLSDLLPEYNLTRENAECKSGDLIAIKITKTASKGKKASATTILDEDETVNKLLLDKSKHKPQYSIVERALPKYLIPLKIIEKSEFSNICVSDNSEIVSEIKDYLEVDVNLYSDSLVSLSALMGIESKISDAINKKVWLDSGAFLYIEPTEAMTVIDVNSGKNSTKKSDDLFWNINVEACETIIDQIILRNLSGIIIVDFINLSDKSKRKELLNILAEIAQNKDDSINIVDMTGLGLVEITRRKSGLSIYEQFYG